MELQGSPQFQCVRLQSYELLIMNSPHTHTCMYILLSIILISYVTAFNFLWNNQKLHSFLQLYDFLLSIK